MLTRTFLKLIVPVGAAFAAPIVAADTNPPWVISGASNAPNIAIFDALTLTAVDSFPVLFTGGVRVAGGDLDGDGAIDIVAGSTTQAQVKIFSGPLFTETRTILPFGPGFQPGVHLAIGHVTGTAPLDIVTGAGAGNSPNINIFSPTGQQLGNTIAAFQPSFVGGVRVATGDVNGDGFADIIAGTGSNGAAVEVFSGKDHQRLLPSLQPPFSSSPSDGIYVAGGDVDGDGFADIIVGQGADSANLNADIKVFSGKSGDPIRDFTAFQSFVGGVRVGSADINGDGFADIIAGQGPGAERSRCSAARISHLSARLSPSATASPVVFSPQDCPSCLSLRASRCWPVASWRC